ncbi:hypothetical protein [Cognatilysobacter bugurensis]|uniref:Secreted protein n=1 Tax=Cognatilysobacter bugurensis TaxID=543356 RepID=A0A918SRF7_9GAMM|nr:hypothetical protein [Lysobacter bugurensis]GHA68220.1 hypothetical protein GCM10007067_00010 [Lysobacter bugurensis]
MRRAIAFVLSIAAGAAVAQTPTQCAAVQAPTAASTVAVLPVAPAFEAPAHRLGAPSGVLEHAYSEAMSAEQVVLRLQFEACMLANAAKPAAPGLPSANDPAAYKPKTEFDNTPWRFDMNQNGKRMTADEFSAWMEARGVRVARGAGAAAVTPPSPPAEAAPESKKD